jgi:plastocyanin
VIRRCVLIALASVTLLAVGPGTPAGAGAYPARVGVSAGEYWLTLSRLNVPAGYVKVEMVNYGEDPHDLKLRRIGGTRTYSISETASGARKARTWRLRAGRYHLWCAASDHRAKGMHAILRVRAN